MLLSAILLTGTLAARPAATTLGEGVLYCATDNGIIYQVQSAAWVTWYPAPAGTGTVTNVATGTGLTGGPITTTGTIAMANTAVTPATYGDAANVPVITVDAQGRITAASEAAISGGGGTPGGSDKNPQYNNAGAFGGIANNASATAKYLQQVSSGTPTMEQVSGSDLVPDTVGPTQLADTAVTPGTYGDSANVAVITVDAQGRITAASEAAISGGSGALTLIEHTTIASNTQTVTFSGLDGNTDGEYLLITKLLNSSGAAPFYVIRPNAATTNYRSSQQYAQGNSFIGANYTDKLVIAFANANATWVQTKHTILPRKSASGVAQPLIYRGEFMNDDGTNVYVGSNGGRWNETSTNTTSLDVRCESANGIGAGSELWLYKLAQ